MARNMSETEAKVVAIIARQLIMDPARVTRTARMMEDLGADSLDLVELTMAFEEAFDVTIEDEQAEQLVFVEDVIRFLDESRVEAA